MFNVGDEVEYREWGDDDLPYPTGKVIQTRIVRKCFDGMYYLYDGLVLGKSRLTLVCHVENREDKGVK